MDQAIINNPENYPGPHIIQDLHYLELDQQQPRQNKDHKYSIYFLIFQAIIVFISLLSFYIGNSKQLGHPLDSSGNVCGESVGFEQYNYIYFTNPVNDKYLNITVCLKECPVKENQNQEHELQCIPNEYIKNCNITLSNQQDEISLIYYDSKKFINVCLPTDLNYFENVLHGLDQSQIVQFLQDLKNGILLVFCMIFFCLLINQILYLLLIKLQSTAIWIIQVVLILGLISLAIACAGEYYYQIKLKRNDTNQQLTITDIIGIIQIQNSNFWPFSNPLYISGILLILAIYHLFDLIMNYKKQKTIGQKIKIVNYYYDYPKLCLQNSQRPKISPFLSFYLIPICLVGLLIAYVYIWVLVANQIFTIGNVIKYRYPFDTFQISWDAYVFGIIHILDLILICLIISGVNKFLIIGVMIENYGSFVQSSYKNNLQRSEKSIYRILKFCIINHFGSLIIGQILILLLKIPRMLTKLYLWIIMFMNPNYSISNIIYTILCMNDRAYLMQYLKAEGFAYNAKSQQLFDTKMTELAQIDFDGKQLRNSCCFGISCICSTFTYLLLFVSRTTIIIQHPINFLLLSFFSSYFITNLFSNIYEINIDYLTILLYRDATKDGQIVGKNLKRPIRLLKERLLNSNE